ncbi:hypothetical protein SDC9_169547 [bioreactor metagenome]|uniref:Uncharacterized protein n=1 Tax=bioreactor metagenome TaxID=1076179 RepID=A0A645GDS9_9ZZZZ
MPFQRPYPASQQPAQRPWGRGCLDARVVAVRPQPGQHAQQRSSAAADVQHGCRTIGGQQGGQLFGGLAVAQVERDLGAEAAPVHQREQDEGAQIPPRRDLQLQGRDSSGHEGEVDRQPPARAAQDCGDHHGSQCLAQHQGPQAGRQHATASGNIGHRAGEKLGKQGFEGG